MEWFKAILQAIGLGSSLIKDVLSPGSKALSAAERKAELDAQRRAAEQQWARELEEKWGIQVPPQDPPDQN